MRKVVVAEFCQPNAIVMIKSFSGQKRILVDREVSVSGTRQIVPKFTQILEKISSLNQPVEVRGVINFRTDK